MPNQKSSRTSTFQGHSATINFIYSFNLKDKDSYIVLYEELTKKYKSIKEGIPEYRKGITPHLTFSPDCAYLEYRRPDKAKVVYYRNINNKTRKVKRTLNVHISKITRFFRTGCTCTISVQIQPSTNKNSTVRFDKEDILSILNLVSFREREDADRGSELFVLPGNKKERLYNIFYKTVADICDKLKITWLAHDCNLTDCKKEVQSPWIVTLVEVDGEVASSFCDPGGIGDDPARSKILEIRKYQHDIAPILFRSVSPDGLYIEPAYFDPPTPNGIPGIYSDNIDARLFVGMSRRSILCICRNRKADPAKYFLPGLLDVCEIIRTRWHMLILMNKVMDKAIRGVTSAVDTSAKKKNTPQISANEQIKEFMYLQQWLATVLEDPGIYTVSGDALIKIYRELTKSFHIDELREMVLGKLNLLDNVYRNRQEFEYLESTPSLRRKKS